MLLFHLSGVEAVSEAQLRLEDVQDAVFSRLLVAHPEDFAESLTRSEAHLERRAVSVRLEAQRVLDVALGLEGRRDGLRVARMARPARMTLALRLVHAADARTVVKTLVRRMDVITDVLDDGAVGRRIFAESGMSQIDVHSVVLDVSYAPVKVLSDGRKLPLRVDIIEFLTE